MSLMDGGFVCGGGVGGKGIQGCTTGFVQWLSGLKLSLCNLIYIASGYWSTNNNNRWAKWASVCEYRDGKKGVP